jgi:hypothetical protein
MVKFVNEAIEGENITYFLLFLDVRDSWDFIRKIKHPDATQQAFLRQAARARCSQSAKVTKNLEPYTRWR